MYYEQLNHYLRLSRLHQFPIGSILSFFPCAWGVAMGSFAANSSATSLLVNTAILAFASIMFHSAACVLNDICDVEFDRKVERTRTRPLVTEVVSYMEAWTLLAFLVVLAWASTFLFADSDIKRIVWPGCVFHAMYPLAKRWTWWPQFLLGLAMNWGYIVGWSSLMPLDTKVVPTFYVGCVCWAIVYDTIYACQDRKDDINAGVKSTAILFGDHVKLIVFIFHFIFVACFVAAGIMNGQGIPYMVTAGISAAYIAWELHRVDINNGGECGAFFRMHCYFGNVIWFGIILDYLTKQLTIVDLRVLSNS